MKERDFFIERIQKSLIGPGADVFGLEDDVEILASHPLQSYYSGILFPERKKIKEIGSESSTNDETDFVDIEGEQNNAEPENLNEDIDEPVEKEIESKKARKIDIYKSVNSYFPTNCGLTFCIDKGVETIVVKFKAGGYKLLGSSSKKDREQIKIQILKTDFHSLIEEPNYPFTDNFNIEEKDEKYYWLFLGEEIDSTIRGIKRKLSDYKKKLIQLEKPINFSAFDKLDLITSGFLFKRFEIKKELNIRLSDSSVREVFDEDIIQAVCYIKVLIKEGKKYVKILLKNNAEKQPANKFSYGNEILNQKALFQVEIMVSASILPYKDEIINNSFDEEAKINNYQYRYLKSYGIGHGTAVTWDKSEKPKWIKTDFLPKSPVRSVSNGFREDEKHFEKIADIKNLSVWTKWTREELCNNLETFSTGYFNWIQKQKRQAQNEPQYESISTKIIANQSNNFKRLKKNIDLLRNDDKAYDTFLLANTAMYLQLVISIDERFSKKEKELYEIKEKYSNVDYKSLTFFENYTSNKTIAYRPFQLAFLLLNLEGVINEESPDRNEIVDLLWFPTGGGKTEAYLAVTAFTILWRRITNPYNFEGVSVIMRYTLRLLTAQQFERASRLIVALEFLNKRQDEIPTKSLCQKRKIGNKETPISIGMWVGGATTPNRIDKAKSDHLNSSEPNSFNKKIDKLSSNYTNADSVENVFQISACPWCGCKTITKSSREESFFHGFSTSGEKFLIECNNDRCDFYDYIPIDVIDDSLYNSPPTLLFATVDKFAQLSHREEGHRFFNSLDEKKLPPDLIIQDELHLLNGPLGSIVGLFELIVEELCTIGKRKPKIIASTATTRNTKKQIANLYGGRSVNIFPPLGITYDDNYFSFTDKENEGKRLHIGFMPTGKTSVDTQVRAILPQLLFAKILLFKNVNLNDEVVNNYWTIASYYNSLKDVGKIYNKVNDEVKTELKRLHKRFNLEPRQFGFNYSWLMNRTQELTSRIPSEKIKNQLNDLSIPFKTERSNLEDYRKPKTDVVSLILASNMFSVGIDVERLNIMLMNGQPKNVAEYIQASSRVARKYDGLVVNLLDSNRAREKSYFENYLPFHQAYYKYVEPLTVTPFTEVTLDKALNSILVCYVRHKIGKVTNTEAHSFQKEFADKLYEIIKKRIPNFDSRKSKLINRNLKELSEEWLSKIDSFQAINKDLQYKAENGLISKSKEFISSDDLFALMNSMREIDTDSIIDVKHL